MKSQFWPEEVATAVACARHLHNRRANVHLILDRAAAVLRGAAADQFAVLYNAGLRPESHGNIRTTLQTSVIVVDGLIGYGLEAAPSGETANLIAFCNEYAKLVLSNDIPSGIDATILDKKTVSIGVLSWSLAATFREDDLRCRTGNGPQNCTVVRHVLLNLLLRKTTLKTSVQVKRLRADWDDRFICSKS